jgi:hypothetical protein
VRRGEGVEDVKGDEWEKTVVALYPCCTGTLVAVGGLDCVSFHVCRLAFFVNDVHGS